MWNVTMRIVGRVQGVGFRAYVVARAREHELTGRVRNLPGGEVSVSADGPREALEALVRDVRRGPSHARVDHVELDWRPEPAGHADFRVDG